MNFQSWKAMIFLGGFEKLRTNHDFPKFSNAHKMFVFEDMRMLFDNLIHIQEFFEEIF